MARLLESGHTMCAGCGVAIAVNMVSSRCPEETIVCCATSCLEVTTSAYPQTAWNSPWIHTAFETVSAMASGVEAGVKRLQKRKRPLFFHDAFQTCNILQANPAWDLSRILKNVTGRSNTMEQPDGDYE